MKATLRISLDDRIIELTIEEAKRLKEKLCEIFPSDDYEYYLDINGQIKRIKVK